MTHDFEEVRSALEMYFDGLYFADVARLEHVFHPQARYVTITGGNLINLSMEEYFAIVRQRQAPALRHEERRDEIVSIGFAGPLTATARLHCSIAERFFTDCLTLIRQEGRWQIISKVFHYDIMAASRE